MTTDIQLPKLKLFLAKPDRTTIGKLKHISGENLLVKSNEVSELSFTLPYYISVNNELIRNPHIDKVKEKFLIRSEFRDKIEWFTIENIDNESDDSEDLHVTCFSLGYQLQYHLVIDYEVISRNCKEATDDILKGTDWTSGYINPKFNLMYRQFDIAQGTKLSAIYEIRETFDSVVVFDTVNKTVNHYTEEELSTYKGFNIGYGKYIQNIKENIDAGEIVTRLYINGSDGLQINSVNPTGQPYIDDFSYFLYPFDMDENENIISHSEYMSDSLAKALVKYNKIVTNRKDDFGNFLSEKTDLQKKLTTEQNSLVELENELIIILDLITIAKNNGESTSELNTRKNNKNNEIKNIKNVINGLNQQIASVDSKLQDLRDVLKMETHLTPTQLNELSNFVQEDEWTDENQFDVNDLYEAGLTQMEKVNAPPINITTNIVNFLRMLSEKHNWERFDVHDIIRINHERLGIDVKTTLTEIHYDFESESIKVSISNTERDLTTEELISGAHYQIAKVDTELNKRKIDWNKTAYNFNIRNDRIEEIPVNPTNTTIKHKSNDNGSVNLVLNWDYPDYNSTKKNEDNIDGFIIYMYSDKTDEPYQFTSKMSEETLIPNITHDKRAHIIPSVPSNLFYTIGIRAYRRVDEDINRDGVLMSEIVGFNQSNNVQQRMLRPMVHTVAMFDEDNPYKSYQPEVEVNINARVNGTKFVTGYDKPTNPMLNDVWIDLSNRKLWIWDGSKWGGDIEIDDIKDQIAGNESHMAEFEKQLREELEKSRLEIEEAMKLVDEEMNRIENEVIPEVEKVVEETTIPKGDTIPEEIPLSGLWMDTSVQPPRLMRWDDELGDWVPLAPTENEITDMIQKAREEVQAEQQRYSRFEILKTRKSITDQINQEIGDVEQHIADLENMAENLKQRVENTEQYVEDLKATIGDDIESIGVIANELRDLAEDIQESIGDFEGRITSVETIVDEVNGYIGSFVEDIERIDGQVNLNTSSIEQHSDLIASKVGSIEYEEDKTGIITNIETNISAIEQLNNQIELRVTRDEFESATEDYDERISTAESTITAHSEAIELKAEKTELTNYVGKTEYNNKVSSLETSINGIAGRVEETEGVLDNVTGELTSVSEKYAQLIIRADGIESEVSRVEEDLDGRISSTHSLAEQNAEAITQKVSSLDYNRDKTGILSSIEQNTTDIEATAQGLLLMVTKEQYETDVEGIEERISSTEATLDIHAEAIELSATKEELLNYVDTQTYTNQMGELTVGIEGITTRVSSAEATINTHTGEIEAARSQIASIDTKVDGIASTVSDLSVDLTTANQNISQIDQKADGIISTVGSIQTDISGLEGEMTAVQTTISQLPDDITLAVTEGIGALEIGGRNYIPNSKSERGFGGFAILLSLSEDKHELAGSNAIVSFEARHREDSDPYVLHAYYRTGSGGNLGYSYGDRKETTTEYQRFIIPIDTDKVPSNMDDYVTLAIRKPSNDGYIYVRNVKLEKGTKATDWTPAPEDIDAEISSLSADLSVQAGKIDAKADSTVVDAQGVRITTAEQTIDAIDGRISLVVSESGTINAEAIASELSVTPSAIDLISDNITLSADQIIFDGHVFGQDATYAGTFKAGIVKAEHIEPNSITTRELLVGDFDNMIQDPYFDTNYHLENSGISDGGSSLGWDIIESGNLGERVLRYRPNGEQTGAAYLLVSGETFNSPIGNIQASQGERFYFEANVRRWNSNPPEAYLRVQARDRNNNILETWNGSRVTPSTSVQKISVTTGEMPEDTRYVLFTVRTIGTGNTGNVYFLNVYARRMIGSAMIDTLRGLEIIQEGASGTIYLDDDGFLFEGVGSSIEMNLSLGSQGYDNRASLIFSSKRNYGRMEILQDDATSVIDTDSTLNITAPLINLRSEVNVGSDLYLSAAQSGGGRNNGLHFGLVRDFAHTINDFGGDFTFYGNRSTGNPFVVRSHANGSSYRDDFVINSRGEIISIPTRDNEVTWSGRVAIGTNTGRFGTVSSSKRFKLAIDDIKSDPYDILKLDPKSWYDKNNTERYAELLTRKHNGEDVDVDNIDDDIVRIPGLIAEEVEKAGLEEFVTYRNGLADGVQYDRIPILFIPILRDHEVKISDLIVRVDEHEIKLTKHEQEINDLKHRIQLKDSQILQLKQRIERLEDLVG